jgi:hypothetical protein
VDRGAGREILMSDPNEVVGHKTFDTGEIDCATGFPLMRHEPLTRAEAEAIFEAADKETAARAEKMPDEKAAMRVMFDAWLRLKELGWSEASYCPKDGTPFKAIEAGSTGIFDCHYDGEWPNGTWWIADAGDLWPSRPILFKLNPEDQAKKDAAMKAAAEKYALDPSHIAQQTAQNGDAK